MWKLWFCTTILRLPDSPFLWTPSLYLCVGIFPFVRITSAQLRNLTIRLKSNFRPILSYRGCFIVKVLNLTCVPACSCCPVISRQRSSCVRYLPSHPTSNLKRSQKRFNTLSRFDVSATLVILELNLQAKFWIGHIKWCKHIQWTILSGYCKILWCLKTIFVTVA